MNKMKLYLQKPWKYSDSPYYLYLRQNPPKNIEYINANEFSLIQNKKTLISQNKLKRIIRKILRKFPSLPNAHLTKNKKADLIHCAHCLSLNKKPWICDIEFVGQFWASGRANKNKKNRVLKILRKENCKKILAWTEWTKKGILEIFPEIKDKIKVVYPAIPIHRKKNNSKKTRLLFISRRFYFKGGLHAIEVIDRLTKRYSNVEGMIVSDTPKEILNKYSKNKKIKFLPLMNQKKIFEKIYPKTNIMVYPSYTDTFGFAFIEALSFGIPVITVSRHSQGEIIKNKKTGFVLMPPKNINWYTLKNQEKTIETLVKMTSKLIKNKKLLKKFSNNAYKEVLNGRFSIKERNKKLNRIYKSALK